MTKRIKILGTGCQKCKVLKQVVEDVVNENHIDASIEKVEDLEDIMIYNVMITPALVIDDVIVIKGRIPDKKEILDLLKSKNPTEDMNTTKKCCSGGNCC
ncbi:thioredoxin family protein [Confluentibacter sediminis]|uniref:thioredoxin family protein n=1 Tax=Confluentibacter sediminis TaxID=2219045 RepID=UPI000DAEFE9D|nr:thioredoxin family protein [Confluentibacter sediminis]